MGTVRKSTWQEKLVASGGSTVIDDTNSHTGLQGLSIFVQTDAVINVCTGFDSTGTAYDFKASKNWVTLYAGALLIVPDDYYIETIDLTSGSIIVNEGV